MRLTPLLSLTIAAITFAIPLKAQIINPTIPTPTTGGAALSRQSVNAGEKVTVTIRLDAPPATPLQLRAVFYSSTFTDSFYTEMTFAAGVTTASAELSVPQDVEGGDYTLSQLLIVGGRRNVFLPMTPKTLHVALAPKPVEVSPSKAVVTLELDQKQFIRLQAQPLIAIRDDLIGGLNRDAASTPQLTASLIAALKAADGLLADVKTKYVSLYKTKPIPVLEPIFFDDFHRNYQAAIIELSAPKTSTDEFIGQPHLVTVQQMKRRPTAPLGDWKSHTLAGTYSLAAMAVIDLIDRNIAAYILISNSGLDTFSIRLASIPSGASILYKRVGEPYTPLTKATDVPSASFPYAMWTFKFEKDGCKTIERTPNPYIEEHLDLTVELVCKLK